MFCFSRAHRESTNSTSLYLIYPILRRLKLGKSLQTSCDNFFRLSWHFKREKSVCWKSSFCKTRTDPLKGLGEFSTVMQTLDFVSGLHNCLEFSQLLECLYQAMQTWKSFRLLKWYNLLFIQNISPILIAKSTRIIHHNQLLMTKFGRMLRLINLWRQKCSFLAG